SYVSDSTVCIALNLCTLFFSCSSVPLDPHSFPTRRSSDLDLPQPLDVGIVLLGALPLLVFPVRRDPFLGDAEIQGGEGRQGARRSEEHTSELQSRGHLVCRLPLEKQKYNHCLDAIQQHESR